MTHSNLLYGIAVYYYANRFLKRSAKLVCGDLRIPNSGCLSNHDLKSTTAVIEDLNKVLSGEYLEYEWGEEQIYIISNKDTSILTDLIFGEKLPEVPTEWLLSQMKAWQAFLQEYRNQEKLTKTIASAFKIIVCSPYKYKSYETGAYYEVMIDNVNVTLQLLEEEGDFKLSVEDYLNQIRLS